MGVSDLGGRWKIVEFSLKEEHVEGSVASCGCWVLCQLGHELREQRASPLLVDTSATARKGEGVLYDKKRKWDGIT